MNEQQLRRAFAWFREQPRRITALRGVNAVCTWGTVAAFCAECSHLALQRDPALLRLGLTCGVPLCAADARCAQSSTARARMRCTVWSR